MSRSRASDPPPPPRRYQPPPSEPKPQPVPEFVAHKAMMVQCQGREELGAIHAKEGRKEWRFEFFFNLADIHLGRFEVLALQQAVREAIGVAFAGHTVSATVFPERQPYSVRFTVVPGGKGFLDLRGSVSLLAVNLDDLLERVPHLPKQG